MARFELGSSLLRDTTALPIVQQPLAVAQAAPQYTAPAPIYTSATAYGPVPVFLK